MSAKPSARASTWVRWPMIFRLAPCDARLVETATHGFELQHDYDAAPEHVHRSFLAFVGEPPWSPGFLGVDWWTAPNELDGAVMDELYAFMSMRVHVIEHEIGKRSVAYVSRWSMPLATRMVQVITVTRLSDTRSRLHYRIAYNPPRVFTPLVPPVQWAFKRWFEISLERLSRCLALYR